MIDIVANGKEASIKVDYLKRADNCGKSFNGEGNLKCITMVGGSLFLNKAEEQSHMFSESKHEHGKTAPIIIIVQESESETKYLALNTTFLHTTDMVRGRPEGSLRKSCRAYSQ